jgi:hypothetical protein
MPKRIIRFLAIDPRGWPPKEVRQELEGIEVELLDDIMLKSIMPPIASMLTEENKPIVILKSKLLEELKKQKKTDAFRFYDLQYSGDYVHVNPAWCEKFLEPYECEIV